MSAPDKRATLADQVSEATTSRLSIYLRCLDQLASAGVATIASKALAARFGLGAAQIRKDLANFGELGVRGVGYDVETLRRHLREILGLDHVSRVGILGAGNLGLALADYNGFRAGFEVAALFDNDPAKVGRRTRGGVVVRHVDDLAATVARERIEIALVAVPAPAAQDVVDLVVGCGIRAILNFSPGALRVPPHVKLKSVDFTVSLETLSFFLASERDGHQA
jgi:redox-sensing transcriptional repressor